MIATIVLIVLAAWVLFNLAAGYAPMLLAQQISPARLPSDLADLLTREDNVRVRFYIGETYNSYAFTVWAPPHTVVLFDRHFFEYAKPDLLRFVLAHELGHARFRHHIKRWISVVTGASLLPGFSKGVAQQEAMADRYAELKTGLSKSMFPQLL